MAPHPTHPFVTPLFQFIEPVEPPTPDPSHPFEAPRAADTINDQGKGGPKRTTLLEMTTFDLDGDPMRCVPPSDTIASPKDC
jgi:hypothetical protein